MHQRRIRPIPASASCVLLFASLSYGPSVRAGEFIVFDKTYTRGTRDPITVTNTFDVLNPNTVWSLRVINGNLEDDTEDRLSRGRVSSSILTLNGTEVLQSNDFSQSVSILDVPVAVLAANTISVELRGKPGGQLNVQIVGQDATPPSAAWLTPSGGSFPNTTTIQAELRLTDDIAGLDPDNLTIMLDGAAVTGLFTPLTQSVLQVSLLADVALSEGDHILTADVSDLAGHLTRASVSFTADRTAPIITGLLPEDGTTIENPRPAVSANYADIGSGIDINSVRLILNAIDVTADAEILGTSVSFVPATDLPDGLHTVQVSVADQAGNVAQAQGAFLVETAPALASMVVSPATPVMTLRSQIVQLAVLGTLSDGTMLDVTLAAEGTLYASSAPTIATVSADGVVSPVDNGQTTITATNGSVTAAALVTVDLLTTIEATSPISGESDVALTRETVVNFSDPIDTTSIQASNLFASFGGQTLPALIRPTTDGRSVRLFYDPPLPAAARVRVTIDGSSILDGRGNLIDADADGVPGGIAIVDFNTCSTTRIPGSNIAGRVLASTPGPLGEDVPLEGVRLSLDGIPVICPDQNCLRRTPTVFFRCKMFRFPWFLWRSTAAAWLARHPVGSMPRSPRSSTARRGKRSSLISTFSSHW